MANAQPLDDAAIARLREELANGKRPSLVLLSGGAGLPAGSRGQLVRIDDPPQDSEFLHLKVGQDELPFSPEEVGLPGRRKRAAGAGDAAAGNGAGKGASKRSAASAAPAARRQEPILEPERPDRRTRAERVVEPPPPPAAPTRPEGEQPLSSNANASAGAGADGAGEGAAASSGEPRPDKPRRPARAGRTGSPPKVTLTLRFADFGWTVEALVAGRRDKPQPVPLAAIRAFADQLEDQALRRQLDSTVEACRNEAQKRAATLRAELAKLETELAALDD